MKKKVLLAQNMGQVIERVNELIELAKRKEIGTRIDDEGISEISAMLIDIDNFTQQTIGKSFAELKCKEVDFVFLNSYKSWLLSKEEQDTKRTLIANNIGALHDIFIFEYAYNIADMDIDMFELFLETVKREGLLGIVTEVLIRDL